MFRGSHITRVDEKGRLKLPAEFKRQIDEEYGGQFYITSRDGKVAEIHPMREWEEFESKLAAVPSFNPAKQKLLKWINYFGQTAEMDGQGRVLLPQLLREKANLLSEVVVSGNEGFLKVENHQGYEQGLEPMTMDDQIELAKVGI
ncbi:MAG TPA: division/cell wall cluster transcriptional repressor MraZ [Acidobacteriaceae bacterium]|jgi:MraZ protein